MITKTFVALWSTKSFVIMNAIVLLMRISGLNMCFLMADEAYSLR